MGNTDAHTEQVEDVTTWTEADPATVLVCGSRNWNKPGLVNKRVGMLRRQHNGPITIVTAKSEGAEKSARAFAQETSLTVVDVNAPALGSLRLKANREQLQRMRNRAMVALKADFTLAFWDGESHGTKEIIDLSNAKGRKGEVIFPNSTAVPIADVDKGLGSYQAWKSDNDAGATGLNGIRGGSKGRRRGGATANRG